MAKGDSKQVFIYKSGEFIDGDGTHCKEEEVEYKSITQTSSNEFIARKVSSYRVICTSPDVCKVPKSTPVPFNIGEPLSSSVMVAKKTNVNSCEVFVYRSNTSKVTGDSPGVRLGVSSG